MSVILTELKCIQPESTTQRTHSLQCATVGARQQPPMPPPPPPAAAAAPSMTTHLLRLRILHRTLKVRINLETVPEALQGALLLVLP